MKNVLALMAAAAAVINPALPALAAAQGPEPQASVPKPHFTYSETMVPMRDRDHAFLKGHRIMVQIQSTWFPLIDRNPQTFTPSIYTAKAKDFVAATQKVYTSPDLASRIILPVVGSGR